MPAPLAVGLLALLVQEPARALPTVGDTIWVRRSVQLTARATARAAEWELSGDVELLGPPELTLRGDSAIVRYPLVAWKPGRHSVSVPAPTLLAADGSVDSLPPVTVAFEVASVLPDRPPATIQPQPPAGLVTRRTVSWLPPVVLGLGVVALLLPVHWWWRRRGKPQPPPIPPEPTPVPIERWAGAGETRSVLALAARRLRAAVAARPDAPESAEVAALLAELDAARFAPASREDALRLYREAETLAGRLGETGA
jgi:hypothetical protein